MISLLAASASLFPSDGPFLLETSGGKISSLRNAKDPHRTEYIAANRQLGDVRVAYRKGQGEWIAGNGDLKVESAFEPNGERLIWRYRVTNTTPDPVEVGGLSTPLPMRTQFDKSSKSSVLKHNFISGAGAFAFWMRPDGAGPYLTMTCLKGTSLEYWNRGPDGYQVFAHSAAEVPKIREKRGSWRLPHTSRTLKPGETAEYGYVFEWAKDYDAVRSLLARNGKLDVQIAPGMTVPRDLFAEVALRSSERIEAIEAEFPAQTDLKFLTTRAGYRIYRVRFRRPGENRLTVRQPGGAKTYLEFFACEPVETLIKKRAAFITRRQVKDASKWYDGLLAEWNMSSGVQLSPDNYDKIGGWRIYEVTCDDPGLSKPAYLAAKNAEYPVQAEVDALDRYIDRFVWGGLQQTTTEKYPYSIYGIPDWKTLRDSKLEDKTKGVDHVWRPYDYPHITLMYHSMYRIATGQTSVRTRLKAREYLQRAAGTAIAMFTVPSQVIKWSAYETGFYNEIVIPTLISDLRKNGMAKEAETLSGHWGKKVKTFAAGEVDLFSSEYAFDSTGFESTGALAETAIEQGAALGIGRNQAKAFLQRQLVANVFCRGFIEPAYYYLGSDYRASGSDAFTLTYMSPMGGGSVMNYALRYASKAEAPAYLRLGYQSLLSSWALMNAGPAESNFGFWYPGAEHDGAAGGGFEPAAYGKTWLDQPHGRGAWYYSCETDLGYCGYLRAARTLVADDPIFGRFCFGGLGEKTGSAYEFVPKDGVRRRVSVRTAGMHLDLELMGARIDASVPVRLDEKAGRIRIRLEPTEDGNATAIVRGASGLRVKLGTASLAEKEGGRYPLGRGDAARWLVIEQTGRSRVPR